MAVEPSVYWTDARLRKRWVARRSSRPRAGCRSAPDRGRLAWSPRSRPLRRGSKPQAPRSVSPTGISCRSHLTGQADRFRRIIVPQAQPYPAIWQREVLRRKRSEAFSAGRLQDVMGRSSLLIPPERSSGVNGGFRQAGLFVERGRDIADADDADQAVMIDYRQVADVVLVHDMTHMFEGVG